MSLRCADNAETVLLVRGKGRSIACKDIGEYLFVALLPRCFKRYREEPAGDSLSPAAKIHIRAAHPDMVQRLRIGREWGHALKANDVVVILYRDMENFPICESCDVRTLGFDGEGRVKQSVSASLNDGVKNRHDSSGIVRSRRSNKDLHGRAMEYTAAFDAAATLHIEEPCETSAAGVFGRFSGRKTAIGLVEVGLPPSRNV